MSGDLSAIQAAMRASDASKHAQELGSSLQSNGVTTDQALAGVMNSVLNLEGKGVGSLIKEGLDNPGGVGAIGLGFAHVKGIGKHGAALTTQGVTASNTLQASVVPDVPKSGPVGSLGGRGH